MTIVLNIGLARNDGQPNHTQLDVINELTRSGLPVQVCTIVQSNTEPTAVVRLQRSGVLRHSASSLRHTLHLVSCFLHQDCIAMYSASVAGTDGHLVGPKAKEWGEFNRAFFLLEDGRPLA